VLNLIKFLRCNSTRGRISIIKECVDNLNNLKLESSLKLDKMEINDEIVYPENVRVIEEKNIKINVKYFLTIFFSFLALSN
jgi:hypothetical protein